MEVIIKETYEEVGAEAAGIVKEAVSVKPDTVLGLATGSTPLSLYAELVRMHSGRGLDFSRVTTFNLDEYLGLGGEHPQSYRYFMRENLFRHINIKDENINIPDGMAADPESHCGDYEKKIAAAGGIDLQVLGIGRDGHIAFNEPGSSLGSRTRIKTLAEETVQDNARFFNDASEVPVFAITMGVATIMESRRILLLANGEKKADITARFIEGPITSEIPASILQMHPAVTVIIDEQAARKLKRSEYYRWVYRGKKKLKAGGKPGCR